MATDLIRDLVHGLVADDVQLYVDGSELKYRAKKGAIREADRRRVRENKAAIIDYLRRLQQVEIEQAVALPPIERAERGDDGLLPLSFSQQRLWFIDQMGVARAQYNLPGSYLLGGEFNVGAFERALRSVLERHEVLRTCFVNQDGEPRQSVAMEYELPWRLHDLSGLSDQERAREAKRLMREEAQAPFDLSRDLMLRVQVLKLSEQSHLVLYTTHHIASDGWSGGILRRELGTLYAAYSGGMENPLPPLKIQYSDFSQWQRAWLQGGVLEEQMSYWREQLKGLPPLLTLPTDRPRPAEQTFRGSMEQFVLPEALSEKLRTFSREQGATLFMTLLTAFAVLLGRYAGQQDVAVGTPIANRRRRETEGLIGLLLNTLVMRHDLSGDRTFVDLLARTRSMALQAYAHQDIPFEYLVEKLNPQRSLSHSPLFQVMFAMQNAPFEALELSGLAVQPLDAGVLEDDEGAAEGLARFDLTLHVQESPSALVGGLEYRTDLFERSTVRRMLDHFARLLEAIVREPRARLSRLQILGDEEKRLLLLEWNATASPDPGDPCVHEQFEEQARARAGEIAVTDGDRSLTYEELDRRANRLSRYLVDQGVGPEVTVGICSGRSVEMVVGLLAILKAGGCYVPLDPEYPAERMGYILTTSGCQHVLAELDLLENLPALSAVKTFALNGDLHDEAMRRYSNEKAPDLSSSPCNSAYVMFTSGSTGKPKGVRISHASLSNYLRYARETYFPGRAGAVVSTALCFDATVTSLLVPLVSGKFTYLLKQDGDEFERLRRIMIAPGQDLVFKLTPAHMEVLESLIDAPAANAHVLVIGGEQLTKRRISKWRSSLLPQSQFVNEYGPTETVVGCSTYWIADTPGSADESGAVPIGCPIRRTSLYTVDEFLELMPIGVPGELLIGGAGVAQGYANQPAQTAARFIPNPFGDAPGERVYRTGDLARWLADGKLEYLGRIDTQVKVRGYRIELGEIESVLLAHEGVRDAVVVVRGEAEDRRLAGYVVAETGAQVDDVALIRELRARLQEQLPAYMVPSTLMVLDSLPLTPNGKLDRKALPAPDAEAFAHREYEAPQGPVERALAELWRALLRVERVGRHDNFFELGGHSLLAVTLIERLRNRGFKSDVRALFGSPTLMQLARTVVHEDAVQVPENRIPVDCERITPQLLPLVTLEQEEIDRIVERVPGGVRNVQDIYPLAPLQEGILFHHLMSAEGDAYLSHALMAFDTRERLDRFLAALQAVIDRHDILRTAVLWEALSQPVQVVWRQAPLAVETVELSAGDAARELLGRFDPRRYRLDIREAPLQKAFIGLDRQQNRWLLMLMSHHLAFDHTALEIISAEAQAHLLGEQDRLAAPVPFREFVAQARLGVSAAEHEEFFRGMLADIEEPTAPFGWLDVRGDGGDIAEAHVPVDGAIAKRIRKCVRVAGVSAASLFHLAWAQVLARLTDREEVVFGTVLFGRMHGGDGASRGVGLFMNTLPLRLSIDDRSAREALQSTHERLGQLLRHEHASLALAQRCSAVPAETPLFTTLLNYRYVAAVSEPAPRAWEGVQGLHTEERTNYPLMLSVNDFGEEFGLTVQVREQVEPRRICELMHEALAGFVEVLESSVQMPMRVVAAKRFLDKTSLLGEAERHRQLVEWNATARAYPDDQCIHALFESQVRQQPDAIALVHEDRELAYAELNRRANQVAHELIERGVGPEVRVGVCLRRSPEMAVGLLGILKAGGCYVPLDPDYPGARLEYMLAQSGCRVVLSDRQLMRDLPLLTATEALPLDADSHDAIFGAHSDANVAVTQSGVRPENLAYVIYTSGSTGQPKGSAVTHRNISRLIYNDFVDYASARTILCAASPSFDAFTFELWGALLPGGRSVMGSSADAGFSELGSVIDRQGIDCAWLTSSLYNQLIVDSADALKNLKRLLVGGEALSIEHVREGLRRLPRTRLINGYGPTEATTFSCTHPIDEEELSGHPSVPIGRPICNTQAYVLGTRGELVPMGVAGELYVGGAGLARGYLEKSRLTAEKFVPNGFSPVPGERLYRTGDLARWLPDGKLEFLGRIDTQVKVRGYRIELGEIESVLLAHEGVRDAVVVAFDESSRSKRLVGYVVAEAGARADEAALVSVLRSRLLQQLPDYMVPAALMVLESLPLTPNGKLDRKALPAPDGGAYAHRQYEAPQGPIERALALLWEELLSVERVGRHDNFFELGGHSLLAVTLIERMRQQGLETDVRALFSSPTLMKLAREVAEDVAAVVRVPENRIATDCKRITPQLLPLVALEQEEIDRIVERVPGGVRNVQDIYPLAPLQEGILFHHLMSTEGDAYLLPALMSFDTRERLDRFLAALQWVVGRHDILRTGLQWEGLSQPVQVVRRTAQLAVEEVELASGDAARELRERFDPRRYRLDIREAPLQKAFIGLDRQQNRWLLMLMSHHLAFDHTALEIISAEAQAHLLGEQDRLAAPVPFREFVAQARLGVSAAEHEEFFRGMLADIEEPTAPFGWLDVRGDGGRIAESRSRMDDGVAKRIRKCARAAGVSAASLCHLAWAQVLARLTNRQEVVFGTVLFGRLHGGEGVRRGVGLFMNTLPLRLSIDDRSAREALQSTHERLGQLLRHEHASLVLAQRCSTVPAETPLFTTLLNYRYSNVSAGSEQEQRAWDGIQALHGEERTNYPLTLSVDDLGEGFELKAQVREQVEPRRICELMHEALVRLVDALESPARTPMRVVMATGFLEKAALLGDVERHRQLVEWNATERAYPQEKCIHELFEAQTKLLPDAIALVHEGHGLTYAELNRRANRIAHELIQRGVGPEARVGLCLPRSPEMVIGILGILKAGGCYVPLDPDYPRKRLDYLLDDARIALVVTEPSVAARVASAGRDLILLSAAGHASSGAEAVDARAPGLHPDHPAYLIYTSASTGTPKGVLGLHRSIVNRVSWLANSVGAHDVLCQKTSLGFVDHVAEIFQALSAGVPLVIIAPALVQAPAKLLRELDSRRVTQLTLVPSLLKTVLEAGRSERARWLKSIHCSGEALHVAGLETFAEHFPRARLFNIYGSTEMGADVTCHEVDAASLRASRAGQWAPLGKNIDNTQAYVLDADGQLALSGAVGELHVGGACLARGYFNRAGLTAENFVPHPFSTKPGERLYRTGDLARRRPDGTLEYLGRIDTQVKVRGFRIELGEIESVLRAHESVRDAVVMASGDSGDPRLVSYVVAKSGGQANDAAALTQELRGYLQEQLPGYMVPSAFVVLESLPLTTTGKLDRKALQAPDASMPESNYMPPEGLTEQLLAQLWCALLKRERVGRHDNFFELGGHSMLAVRLADLIRQEFAIELPLQAIFESPTVALLSKRLGSGQVELTGPDGEEWITGSL